MATLAAALSVIFVVVFRDQTLATVAESPDQSTWS